MSIGADGTSSPIRPHTVTQRSGVIGSLIKTQAHKLLIEVYYNRKSEGAVKRKKPATDLKHISVCKC